MAFLCEDVTDDAMNDSYVRVTACCGRSMKPLLSVTNDCDRSRCHRQKKSPFNELDPSIYHLKHHKLEI